MGVIIALNAPKDNSPMMMIPGPGFLVVMLALGGGTLLGVGLAVAGAHRGVPCMFPCALFSLGLVPALFWIGMNQTTLWSESRIEQFAGLSDGRTVLWGPAVVTLGPNNELERYARNESEPPWLIALGDGRVFTDGDQWFTEIGSDRHWLIAGRLLQVGAGPSGRLYAATSTASEELVWVTSFSREGLEEKSWKLVGPKGAKVGRAGVALFSDGAAAIAWEQSGSTRDIVVLTFYGPDGAPQLQSAADLGCGVQLTASRDGSIFVMAQGGCDFALLRIQRDGRVSTQFAPDQTLLGQEMSMVRTVLELPDGSVLYGGEHRILKLDASGRIDPNFACRFQGPLEQMALQGDKIVVLEGGRVRRFLRDGREDPSFRIPALETPVRGGGETRVRTWWSWIPGL